MEKLKPCPFCGEMIVDDSVLKGENNDTFSK